MAFDSNNKGRVISQASLEDFDNILNTFEGFQSNVMRLDATIKLMGGWDKLKMILKPQDEQKKLHQADN